jgi:hypothetical protein
MKPQLLKLLLLLLLLLLPAAMNRTQLSAM